jgi:tRNA-2-methylthio-N6-dimethylallyladenosine synthase
MSGKYLVRTFGCQMNEHDSERIAGLLEADGMEATTEVADADVVVLNTCCIRENADNKLYGTLGHLKSLKDQRPGLEIMVAGCLAQKDRDLIAERAPHVDVVLGTHNVHRAVDLLHEHRVEGGPVVEILEETVAEDHELFPSALPVVRQVGYAGWITIQIGCDNSCAFCIVPAVRGPEISRPFGDVLAEVERAAADGVTEITLLGQNVNSFGRDLTLRARKEGEGDAVALDPTFLLGRAWVEDGTGKIRPLFADLLRAVGSVPGIRRVRYTSPHPKDLRPETIAAMAEVPSVCEHLHLPLQSGSDRVLAAMHRGYTAERYLQRLQEARAGVPDLAVSTDIIVGFPGETDAEAEATLEVAAEARFDSAFTFVYSPRPGTEAAELTDRFVPRDVAAGRMERLRAVVERSSLLANRSRIGRIEEVLVEGPSRRDPSRLTGRTRQNRLVHFATTDPLRAGTYARVEVTDATTTSLRGHLVEVLAPAVHRTRIPVASS